MTICFITPPSPFLLDERVFPALGILKVAASAALAGYQVEHLDLNGVENFEEAVLSHCADTESRIFAMTATTPQMVSATKIRKVIQHALPQAKLIIGGPHPTLVNAAWKTNPSIRSAKALSDMMGNYDVVVAGDGEVAILEALQPKPPILIDADDPKSYLFLRGPNLTLAPFPDRSLIDLQTYHYQIDDIDVTPLIGQLGCPFGCNFCAGRDSAMLRRIRLRSTESILNEMRYIFEHYGIHGFMFFDDELNVNTKVMELLTGIDRLQHELKVEFRCRGFVKAELFTDEQAAAMYRAGFRRIMCGFESGSDRILKNINKRATKEENTRAMEISHRHGLQMKALMSLGHPGESPETIEETILWLKQVAPSDFDITIITAYPGSPYYDRAVPINRLHWEFQTNGDSLYMYDIDYTQVEDFYKGSIDSYKSYVFTDYLTDDEIVRLRDSAEHELRAALGIPYYTAGAATRFEASMGQLPGSIYRRGQ